MIIIEILRFLDIADDSVASEIVLVFSLIFAHLFFFSLFFYAQEWGFMIRALSPSQWPSAALQSRISTRLVLRSLINIPPLFNFT